MSFPCSTVFTEYRFPMLFCICYTISSIVTPFLYTTSHSIGTQYEYDEDVFRCLITVDKLIFGLSVVITSYFGGKAQRKAKWIGCGFAVIAIGCFLFSLTAFVAPLPPVEVDESHLWKGIYQPATKEEIASPHALLNSYWGQRFPSDVQQHLNHTGHKLLASDQSSNRSTRWVEIENMLADAMSDVRRELSFGMEQMEEEENEEISSDSHSLMKRQLPDFDFPDSTRDRLKAGFEAAVLGMIWFGDSYDVFAQQVYNLTNDPEIFDRIMKSARLPFAYCRNTTMLVRERIQHTKCLRAVPNSTLLAYVVAFLAFGLIGVGCAMICTIGLTHVEDLIGWKGLPKFIVTLSNLQFIGALIGILVGLVCEMLIYSTLTAPSSLNAIDPRWVGAWWLGLLLISIFLMTFAIAIIYYDTKSTNQLNIANGLHETDHRVENAIPMKEKSEDSHLNGTVMQSSANMVMIKGLFDAIRQVIRPPIYATLLFALMLHVISFYGYALFVPTYLRNNFRVDRSVNGFYTILATGLYFCVGIGLGAFLVYRSKFDSRRLTLCMLGCSFVIVTLSLCQEWLTCNNVVHQIQQIASKSPNGNARWDICDGCICESASFYPVCANDTTRTVYYSPCHAGCTNFTYRIVDIHVKFTFDYCACAKTPRTLVSRDFCQDDCANVMITYFLLFGFTCVASGMLLVPSIIIAIRSTRHEYRALALGIMAFFVYVFGILPSTFLYRFVTDSSCFAWKSICDNGKGYCEIYDTHTLRERYHGFTSILNLIAYLLFGFVWYHSKHLTLTKPNAELATAAIVTPSSEFESVDLKKENDQNGETMKNGNGEMQEHAATFVGKM